MHEAACNNAGALHIQNEENLSQGSFLGKKNLSWIEIFPSCWELPVGTPIPQIPHQAGWDSNTVDQVLGNELVRRRIILPCVCLDPLFEIIYI